MRFRWTICSTLLAMSLACIACSAGCGQDPLEIPPTPPPSAMVLGEESTLEIMTWNIENFPKTAETAGLVRAIIDTLDVDLVAIQEIGDTTAFRGLIQSLEGYQGIYSGDTYGNWYQKTGILYKESIVSVTNQFVLFQGENAFPRPPMKFSITASKNGNTFDFRLIVLHLKAGGDTTDLRMRRDAATRLEEYLDGRLEVEDEKDHIVAGDWNDRIDDSIFSNVFLGLLHSDNYRFLTEFLTYSAHNVSHIPTKTLIDHILVSEDVLGEYQGGTVHAMRPDEVYPDYLINVSDHRPVMVKFRIF